MLAFLREPECLTELEIVERKGRAESPMTIIFITVVFLIAESSLLF
jgi:hypothetical protein